MERKSNFEAYRIVCILLIVIMHTFGTGTGQVNTHLGIFVNVIGNIGVTGFVLLSGYFGIRLKVKKLIKLDIMMIFWSVTACAALIFNPYLNVQMGRKDILSCFIPFISHKYWFLSAYFCLCILSPFLNEYIEKIDKKRLEKLILMAGALFLVLPTIAGFDQTKDGGKGIINMILSYIIGRYIGLYHKDKKVSVGKLVAALFGVITVNFLLNDMMFLLTGSLSNYFARDNSVLTMVQAVLLLFIVMQSKGSSKLVNAMAVNVVAVYVLEDPIKLLLGTILPYGRYMEEAYYIFIVIGISILTYLAGCLLEAVRKLLFDRAENFAIEKAGNVLTKRFKIR
ncbi:MAG: acyltransferase [Thermoflexaceae bacterium]|nr:acyltransferase [Thermoflexaceae bacterium]